MGGGGAMRAAAKVAGISTLSGPFRSGSGSAAENTVSVAARNTIRPISATACDGKTTIEQSQVQQTAFELEDWEFACFEGEQQYEDDQQQKFVSDKNDQIVSKLPRVVFGPVPTFEETKEATSELTDALEKVYLSSSNSCGSAESISSLPETKACVNYDTSLPKGALQAFTLLKESIAAQTVVASIASDPNVWSAVMQNQKLIEFLEPDRKSFDIKTRDPPASSIDAEPWGEALPKNSIIIDDAEEPARSNDFIGLIHDAKITVIDMVNRLTSFVANWFNVSDTEKKGETTYDSSNTFITGGTFMALAVMVIMVVLMKRN